ncbi:MAG: M23 family metallopeptidase [Parachlamydia sp.]|nr:M23 family metallopeptidase [Parachlamydia sp.]
MERVVFIDIGHVRFAFYAHFQPESLKVKMGEKVERGQVIALLGNSGNSDAPHLHFAPGPYTAPLRAVCVLILHHSWHDHQLL